MVAWVVKFPVVLFLVFHSCMLPTARMPIENMAMAITASSMVKPLLFFDNLVFLQSVFMEILF
jgi:hypothetical protein